MGTSCVVKLSNTTVEKATITGTDSYKLLDAYHSIVNELDVTMAFSVVDSGGIVSPIMSIESSKINVTLADMADVTHDDQPLISSDRNSSSYFQEITEGIALLSSPTWTASNASAPTFGNNMSFNIYEYVEPPPG